MAQARAPNPCPRPPSCSAPPPSVILQRQENNFTDVIGNAELADKYIRMLKNYE